MLVSSPLSSLKGSKPRHHWVPTGWPAHEFAADERVQPGRFTPLNYLAYLEAKPKVFRGLGNPTGFGGRDEEQVLERLQPVKVFGQRAER